MDRSKVYIGVYISDNQESLFYRKNVNTFYDLKRKKKVSSVEIDKDSLIPYNDIIESKSNFKGNIIKLYDLDRMEKVYLSRVYIGSSYQISEIIDHKSFGKTVCDASFDTKFKATPIKEKILLFSSGNSLDYADFKDMEKGDVYKKIYKPSVGNIFIPNDITRLKPAATVLNIESFKIEKGILLKMYRDYKRKIMKREN